MNFHIKDGLVVEFTAYEGEILKEGTLTTFTLSHIAPSTITDASN